MGRTFNYFSTPPRQNPIGRPPGGGEGLRNSLKSSDYIKFDLNCHFLYFSVKKYLFLKKNNFTKILIAILIFKLLPFRFLQCIVHVFEHLFHAFKRFCYAQFGRDRPNNVENMAFFAYFRQNQPKLFFLKIFNYAFRRPRKTLKTIKDSRRSRRIRFQLLKHQNRPPSDRKMTKCLKYFSENVDFSQFFSRKRP